jgi:hypothetical protein
LRNKSCQIWRTARRPSCRSKRSTSTCCHQLRDVAMKVAAGVGVELRRIYLPGRHSHHPNDAPQQKSPNPTYKTNQRGPPSSCHRSGNERKRGPASWSVKMGGRRSRRRLSPRERGRLMHVAMP